jgi:hypothetical protein
MDLERLDDQQAFIDLRQAARSSRRQLRAGAGGPVVGLPLPHGRSDPTGAADGRVAQLDMGARKLTVEVGPMTGDLSASLPRPAPSRPERAWPLAYPARSSAGPPRTNQQPSCNVYPSRVPKGRAQRACP